MFIIFAVVLIIAETKMKVRSYFWIVLWWESFELTRQIICLLQNNTVCRGDTDTWKDKLSNKWLKLQYFFYFFCISLQLARHFLGNCLLGYNQSDFIKILLKSLITVKKYLFYNLINNIQFESRNVSQMFLINLTKLLLLSALQALHLECKKSWR